MEAMKILLFIIPLFQNGMTDRVRYDAYPYPTPQPTTSTYMPPCWTQTTPSTTKYMPPCWTQTTPKPTTPSTAKYMPPCWTQTTPKPTTAKYMPPCWTQTTPKPTTAKYMPPCWTQTTPEQTTPSTAKYMPPCWTQTTPRTAQSPELANFFCENADSFYTVPNECDTYIECKDYVASKHFCPEGLVYKPSTIWPAYPCVLPTEYQCLNGSITQPARPSFPCPHQDGYFPLPGGDCTQYIVCEQGIATVMNCAERLVFNEEISACDWPINVPSCHPNALIDFTCPNEDDTDSGRIYKYRYYNSCKKFVACQSGFPRLLSCDHGLRFDESTQTCVDDSYVLGCEE